MNSIKIYRRNSIRFKTSHNLFYVASVMLIPKFDRDIFYKERERERKKEEKKEGKKGEKRRRRNTKESYRPTYLMNIKSKILNKVQTHRIHLYTLSPSRIYPSNARSENKVRKSI